MVSIIKNQLLKHLSRFTKNLSADKINLSTFKGEGELTNLELNEDVLTDLLELPCWLRLTKAWCNKVTFRITWTKLKTVPICLSLDEVDITVETCEELRPPTSQDATSPYSPGKYSFIHKVIDGITITVNTVNISFNSPAFVATLQIQRIIVESVTPKFSRMELPMTRLKNPEKGQLLIFKELQWQTVRIEAKSTKDNNLTPLRLLTNQARCRITIKKRLSDCFILGSRLVIILDDLLWVLTDSQLKAALHFLNSLSGLIQRATQLTRKLKAARKLEELPEYQAQLAQEALQNVGSKTTKAACRMFALYDVVETSYHFMSNQIVLHLCDDPGTGRSSHPNLQDGGALQISIKRFQVDFYPYHLAKGDRKHWPTYNSCSVPHAMWQEQALASFKSKFMDLFDYNKTQHVPLSRKPKTDGLPSNQHVGENQKPSSPSHKEVRRRLEWQLNKLMTTSVVMRVDDFTVYRVTTSGKKQVLKEFLCGDRNRMSLPRDASIIHAEYIYYYYPSDAPFPLPAPKFYVQVNPIQIIFDRDTCLWLNCFLLNLCQSFSDSETAEIPSSFTYIDIKIEAILPRLNFESSEEHHNQRDRPKCLSMQVTRATITNVRTLEHSSRADLGPATSLKSRLVSNKNLYYLAARKNIGGIIKVNDFQKNDWLSPGFKVPDILESRLEKKETSLASLYQLSIPREEQISGKLSKATINAIMEVQSVEDLSEEGLMQLVAPSFKCNYVGDKKIADCVEALLGAYFQTCGIMGGIKFIEWMGIIPESQNLLQLLRAEPKNPVVNERSTLKDINYHIPDWQIIEDDILGYHFKNRGYLLQALTHASYTSNRVTQSYEMLEFVGDAILDFLITCHIFESCGNLSPGALTDLRSALVNNITFANLVVRYNLHKYLLMINIKLQNMIDRFAGYLDSKQLEIDEEVLILLEEDDAGIKLAEYVDVPKVLGDIFEALAGAVYLDCGKDLEVTWKVFHRLMWREIEAFSANVPKNLVRKLYEWNPDPHPTFGSAVAASPGKVMVPLQFMLHGRKQQVYGFGSNKLMAKKAAAKLALRQLQS